MPNESANTVVGRQLIARKDNPVYSSPGGLPIGLIVTGNATAPVFSFIERNGVVWWMFDYTIPGQTPGAYYVKQEPGAWKLSINPQVAKVEVNTSIFGDSKNALFKFSVDKWLWIVSGLLALILILKLK